MPWLVLSYFLTIGTVNQQYFIDQSVWKAPDNSIFTTLGTELVAFNAFFLSAEVQTEQTYAGFFQFAPFFSQYTVKAGLRWGGIEFGYVDNCIHPTLNLQYFPQSLLYGGYSGFYVKFSGSIAIL
jgi:hypothetical protein